jgi:lysozyme
MNKAKIVGNGFLYALMFIAGWEGKSLSAYRDIIGVPTICYGHTEGVQMGDTATDAECRNQLKAEAQVYWDRVDDLVKPAMTPWQHAALTSFSYNVGLGAFQGSTLLALANKAQWESACLELLKWIKAGRPKRVVQGLVNRRQAEFQLCIGASVYVG